MWLNLLVTISVLIHTFSEPSIRAQNNSAPGRIEGRIIDAMTGQAVEEVRVSKQNGDSTLTDAGGEFRFERVGVGVIRLNIEKSGYLNIRNNGQNIPTLRRTLEPSRRILDPYLSAESSAAALTTKTGLTVNVPTGRTVQLVIPIFRSPMVSGLVVDSDGEPLQDATVVPFRYTYDENGDVSPEEDARTARTNDRGEFRFTSLEPGDYGFRVDGPRLKLGEVRAQYYYSTYYGGGIERDRASLVTVKAGDSIVLNNIMMLSGTGTQLQVRLSSEATKSNARPSIITVRRSGEPAIIRSGQFPSGATDCEIGALPNGIYEVQTSWVTSAGVVTTIQTVTLLNDRIALTLSVPNLTTVQAHVTIQDDQKAEFPIAGVQWQLAEASGARFYDFPKTDQSGLSRLQRVVATGVYRVLVGNVPQGTFISAIFVNGQNSMGTDFVVKDGDDLIVKIALGRPSGIIRGSVSDATGQVVPSAVVALVPDDRQQKQFFLARITDDQGNFRIENTPGAYHIYAWREIDGAAYRNQQFLGKYDRFATPLRIEGGSNAILRLKTLD